MGPTSSSSSSSNGSVGSPLFVPSSFRSRLPSTDASVVSATSSDMEESWRIGARDDVNKLLVHLIGFVYVNHVYSMTTPFRLSELLKEPFGPYPVEEILERNAPKALFRLESTRLFFKDEPIGFVTPISPICLLLMFPQVGRNRVYYHPSSGQPSPRSTN